MTASPHRWTCPVCAHRFLHLSQLVEHVEAWHPADNVTLLEPTVGPTDEGEGMRTRARETPQPNGQTTVPRPHRVEEDPLVDQRTGLATRRAWMDALATEEDRCRRHGMDASILLFLVRSRGSEVPDDEFGRAASLVSRQIRAHDTVARLRDEALGVLAVQCSEADAAVLSERTLEVMRTEQLSARAAVGARGRRLDLFTAWEKAEDRLRHSSPSEAFSLREETKHHESARLAL